MHDEIFTGVPKDDAHFWQMVEDNFEFARQLLEDTHIESEEEAIAGTFRSNSKGKYAVSPLRMISKRNVDGEYDQTEYCVFLGREQLPALNRLIAERNFCIEFAQRWGVLQYCHGYLATHHFATNDDFASKRGAAQRAQETSVRHQKIWVSAIIAREMIAGKNRKESERVVEETTKSFMDTNGHGEAFPKEWFQQILDDHGHLKTTYGKAQISGRSAKKLSESYDAAEFPPLSR